MVTRETRHFVPGKRDSRRSSLNSESVGMKWRESEMPIVAMKSGNADGVKASTAVASDRTNIPYMQR